MQDLKEKKVIVSANIEEWNCTIKTGRFLYPMLHLNRIKTGKFYLVGF
jgi:hypothetical protein